MFLEDHVTLVKLIIFVKQIFPAVVQMYPQIFFAWFLQFRAYGTRCPHFCEHQTGAMAGHSSEVIT